MGDAAFAHKGALPSGAGGTQAKLGLLKVQEEGFVKEADLIEGQWRGKLDTGKPAVITVLGGRVVQFMLGDASQPITKSTMDGKTISFGDRRYAVSLTLDGASEVSVEFTGPGESAVGVLRKQ